MSLQPDTRRHNGSNNPLGEKTKYSAKKYLYQSGYAIWYVDMPRIIYSFLEQYDLSGKTIIPFVTSGGSGFSNTISTISDLELEASVITEGLSISRNVVQDAEQDIIQWVENLGYIK